MGMNANLDKGGRIILPGITHAVSGHAMEVQHVGACISTGLRFRNIYMVDHMHIQFRFVPDFLECNWCMSLGVSVEQSV